MNKNISSTLSNALGIALGVIIGLFAFNYIQKAVAAPKFVSIDTTVKLQDTGASPPFIIVKDGCPYCEAAEKFISANNIDIRYLSINDDKELTSQVMAALGTSSFPTLVLKDRMLVGFHQGRYEEFKASLPSQSAITRK